LRQDAGKKEGKRASNALVGRKEANVKTGGSRTVNPREGKGTGLEGTGWFLTIQGITHGGAAGKKEKKRLDFALLLRE